MMFFIFPTEGVLKQIKGKSLKGPWSISLIYPILVLLVFPYLLFYSNGGSLPPDKNVLLDNVILLTFYITFGLIYFFLIKKFNMNYKLFENSLFLLVPLTPTIFFLKVLLGIFSYFTVSFFVQNGALRLTLISSLSYFLIGVSIVGILYRLVKKIN